VSSQHRQRSWTQLHSAVFARPGFVTINARDPRFGQADDSLSEIDVCDRQRNLLRRPQAREEPKLVVVALGFAPITMDGGILLLVTVGGSDAPLLAETVKIGSDDYLTARPHPGYARVLTTFLDDK
jgi:hypothetical protein